MRADALTEARRRGGSGAGAGSSAATLRCAGRCADNAWKLMFQSPMLLHSANGEDTGSLGALALVDASELDQAVLLWNENEKTIENRECARQGSTIINTGNS